MERQRVVIGATEFKAKCLSLLDQIEHEGIALTVTRRGRPIAVLQPVAKTGWKSPKNRWAAKVKITGDIVHNDLDNVWDVVREKQ
jgi:prevent-host-death family protein